MTSENNPAPAEAPPKETLASLGRRLDHADLMAHDLERRLDTLLTQQAELLDIIRQYRPLLDRYASLAASPIGAVVTGDNALTRALANHAKRKADHGG